MNGAAAHCLTLARSSGSESELSAVRFSTYSFAGDIHERTLRSRHASLRRTGHRRNRSAPILNYQFAFRFMTGHFIISRLLEKASRSSVGHPYALGAGLDALGSRPHLFRAGLDALHLIRAVILLPGPDLDLLVLSDLFVPVVVGEAGLEQVVTVLLERGVVHVRSEPVVFKDGASGWHLHPLRLIDRPSLPVPGGAAVRAAPVGLCSGIELRGFAVGIVGIGAVLTDIVPGCFVLAAGPDTPPRFPERFPVLRRRRCRPASVDVA